MKKLELKHLAAYLPYGFKAKIAGQYIDKIIGLFNDGVYNESYHPDDGDLPLFIDIKPILRPLSDLTKEIEVNGEKFVPCEKLGYESGYKYLLKKPLKYNMVFQDGLKLFEWHFDVFGLIPEGLAIDINTLNK